MRIKGITTQQLYQAVQTASKEYDGNIRFKREPEAIGNFLHFTLTVNNSREHGGRISHSGRRVAALCWHGHRDVMREIFKLAPDALLITALARYEGIEGFEDLFEETGYRNIGSMYAPMDMCEACHC